MCHRRPGRKIGIELNFIHIKILFLPQKKGRKIAANTPERCPTGISYIFQYINFYFYGIWSLTLPRRKLSNLKRKKKSWNYSEEISKPRCSAGTEEYIGSKIWRPDKLLSAESNNIEGARDEQSRGFLSISRNLHFFRRKKKNNRWWSWVTRKKEKLSVE